MKTHSHKYANLEQTTRVVLHMDENNSRKAYAQINIDSLTLKQCVGEGKLVL